MITPCSVAVEDSDWYRALVTYKEGAFDSRAPVLATVLSTWLEAFGRRLAKKLGGPVGMVTVVPSKKRDHPTPLWKVAQALPSLRPLLRKGLVHTRAPAPAKRDQLIVDHFDVVAQVDDVNVVLIEDTWVTGQTSVSSALALARAGARSIAILPIARMVYPDTYTDSYGQASAPPWAPRWPS